MRKTTSQEQSILISRMFFIEKIEDKTIKVKQEASKNMPTMFRGAIRILGIQETYSSDGSVEG